MKQQTTRDVFDNPKMPVIFLVLAGFIILFGAGYIWYTLVYTSPERTFWGMMENNLQTRGVTKTIKQDNQQGSITQHSQIEFASKHQAKSYTHITQKDETRSYQTTVISKAINTPTKNYVKYVDIETASEEGEDLDFSEVIGVWGKEDVVDSQEAQNTYTELVFGLLPFADLQNHQRQKIMDFIKDNNVYEVDFDQAEKINSDGRSMYEYPIRVNMASFVAMLIKIDELKVINQLEGLDPEVYQFSPATEFTATVDISNRQLRHITHSDGEHQETYRAFGAYLDIDIPKETIPRQELEEVLQEVLQ